MASCMGDHIIRYFPLAESPTWSSSERSTSMLIRVMAQARPARVYEGALLFVTEFLVPIGILHIKENGGGTMTEGPRSP